MVNLKILFQKIRTAEIARIRKHLIKYSINRSEKIKLIIGSGATSQKEWISTDIDILDITRQEDWDFFFRRGTISNILAEHVLEHLNYTDAETALVLCLKYLEPKGILRIAVPDKNHPSEYQRNMTRPGGAGEGSDDHKFFWDIDSLSAIMGHVGFIVRPLEFFDNDGIFHYNEYEEADGIIKRCSRGQRHSEEFDRMMLDSTPQHLRAQFIEKDISFSSLIIDGIKPDNNNDDE